jgi:hypothetical protein
MEPFQDDILSRRLDDLTHQMRMLYLSFSTFQLEQHEQRRADRWALAEATQKALAEMLTVQSQVLSNTSAPSMATLPCMSNNRRR